MSQNDSNAQMALMVAERPETDDQPALVTGEVQTAEVPLTHEAINFTLPIPAYKRAMKAVALMVFMELDAKQAVSPKWSPISEGEN